MENSNNLKNIKLIITKHTIERFKERINKTADDKTAHKEIINIIINNTNYIKKGKCITFIKDDNAVITEEQGSYIRTITVLKTNYIKWIKKIKEGAKDE